MNKKKKLLTIYDHSGAVLLIKKDEKEIKNRGSVFISGEGKILPVFDHHEKKRCVIRVTQAIWGFTVTLFRKYEIAIYINKKSEKYE